MPEFLLTWSRVDRAKRTVGMFSACTALPSHCQFCYPLGVSGSNFLAVSQQFNSFEEEGRFISNWNKGIYGSGIIFQNLL